MKRTPLPNSRWCILGGATATLLGTLAWAATTMLPTAGTGATGTGVASTGTTQGSWEQRARNSILQNEGDPSFYYAMTTKARGPTERGNKDAVTKFAVTRPLGALTALPVSGDPVKGTFSPVAPWPLVGIHAVLTADGRVLTYGTKTNGIQTGYYVYDLWTPQLGLGSSAHNLLPNTTAVDLFCNAQQLLPTGDIEMYGGDVLLVPQDFSANDGNDESNLLLATDDSLIRTAKMFRKRWYATATTLPNGEVFVQGGDGGKDFPEVRTSSGAFRLLSTADTGYISSYYPRNFVAPDGKIFGINYTQMFRIDPSGTGTLTRAGKFYNGNSSGSSTSVMFRPGKILQVGGGIDKTQASPNASVININPAMPTITALPKPTYARHWANATVLADGRVLLSGGSPAQNDPIKGVAYTSEIYDPVKNSWSLGATAQQMRLYHSAALLLPDATVLTLGGGALGGGNPGPQLNLNAEVYYPPYLFNADGTPAARPIISTAPMSIAPATKFRIGTPTPGAISRVTLIKSGSVTHSFDMNQRFLELPFTVVGDELEATLPSNIYETPPGFYLVFVIDEQGVPSEAAMMRINIAGQTQTTATLTVRKIVVNDNGGTKTAADFGFSVNGGATVAFNANGSNVLTVPAGTYSITEPASTGYTASLSGCSNISLIAGGSATCTITNDDIAVASDNLVVNGDFEINSLSPGTAALVNNVLGWTNTVGAVKLWKGRNGYLSGSGQSHMEIDVVITVPNAVYQDIPTVAGASYDLSFLQSPRPGYGYKSNRFEVWWNDTLLGAFARDGTALTNTNWQRANYIVTGTGNDRVWFKEFDADIGGAFIDDVRLTQR